MVNVPQRFAGSETPGADLPHALTREVGSAPCLHRLPERHASPAQGSRTQFGEVKPALLDVEGHVDLRQSGVRSKERGYPSNRLNFGDSDSMSYNQPQTLSFYRKS